MAPCPPELPSGFFWYGTRWARPGWPPKWVNQLLQGDLFTSKGRDDPFNDQDTIGPDKGQDAEDVENSEGSLSEDRDTTKPDENHTEADNVENSHLTEELPEEAPKNRQPMILPRHQVQYPELL